MKSHIGLIMSLLLFSLISVSCEYAREAKVELQRLVTEAMTQYPEDFSNYIILEESDYQEKQGIISIKQLELLPSSLDLPEWIINTIKDRFIKSEPKVNYISPITNKVSRREVEMAIGVIDIKNSMICYHISIAKIKGAYVNKYEMMCKSSVYTMRCGDFLKDHMSDEMDLINSSLKAFALTKLNDGLANVDNTIIKEVISSDKLNSVSLNSQREILIDVKHRDTGITKSHSFIDLLVTEDRKPFEMHFNRLNGQISIKDKNNKIVWESLSNKNSSASPFRLIATDKGNDNLIVLNSKNKPKWDLKNQLYGIEFILLQNHRYYSANGLFFLLLQDNGVLCIYKEENEGDYILVWESGMQYGKDYISPYSFIVDNKGVASIKNGKNVSIWEMASKDNDTAPYTLELNNKGILNLYDRNGKKVSNSIEYLDA